MGQEADTHAIRDGRRERAHKKAVATRKRILDAALKLFARQGYNNTSIDDLARASGVGRATIYLHFRGKAEILKTLTDDMLEQIDQVISPINMEDTERSEMEQTLMILDNLISVQKRNPQLAELILQGSISEETDAILMDFYRALNNLIVEGLEKAISIGIIRSLDIEVAARCILGALKEVLIQPLARGEISPEKARSMSASMVDFVHNGLRL